MPPLDKAEFGKVIASFRLDRTTTLELRHRWTFHEEFAALMIGDDHGCRSEILVPVSLVPDLQHGLRWLSDGY